jgi:hypothetical protein
MGKREGRGMGTGSVEPLDGGAGKRAEVKRHVQGLVEAGVLWRGARLHSLLELDGPRGER